MYKITKFVTQSNITQAKSAYRSWGSTRLFIHTLHTRAWPNDDPTQGSLGWVAKVFIAAISPFGPFFIEPALRREQAKLENKVENSSYTEQ